LTIEKPSVVVSKKSPELAAGDKLSHSQGSTFFNRQSQIVNTANPIV